jgi:hypothetical protein
MIAMLFVLIPVIVLIPAMRLAAGALFLLVGLFAWASMWAVRS